MSHTHIGSAASFLLGCRCTNCKHAYELYKIRNPDGYPFDRSEFMISLRKLYDKLRDEQPERERREREQARLELEQRIAEHRARIDQALARYRKA